ncbi:PQQ-binding-like beta-propeller repeat protein [Bacteroides sp. UBA939]|uniref:outer membrane protein assembly factor BamB family protein n=1 Tax=Bacteroides sp. UBA939 TaxID=1946092 RepID=UPI0025BA7D58|nr:PQQ-binding-like beta-propeller repeat protein [Bacteroides sp. UBA939]
MKQLLSILTLCLLLSCSGHSNRFASGSKDWKLFRGDPSLSGYTTTDLPEKPTLLWTYKSEGKTASSPVIDNGTTYWCDKRGHVRGVDINGTLVFEYDLQTAVEATPMIYDSILYVGRIDGFMTAISLAKKDTIWNYETTGQISASPNAMTFEGCEAIVFGSYDNFLYYVDAQNGKELSRFESGYYLNGAAALWKGYAVFGGCDAYVRVIDCRTGVQTDSLLLDAYVPASPAIMDDCCYVGDYSGNIYELALKEGRIIRHNKIITADSENGSFVSVPAVSDEALFVFSGDRNLCSVNRKSGNPNWKYLLKGTVGESAPVVCNDKVIACTKTGIVSIFDADSGELLWEYDTGEQITGSPAIIKDHFMVLTVKGTLFCFGDSER